MASVLAFGEVSSAPAVRHKRWTREECARVASVIDLEPYELIEGELVDRMGKGHAHSYTLMLIMEWLRAQFPARQVAQEVEIDVRPEDNPTSEPQPDALVLACSFGELAPRPQPADIWLLIEVADSSLSLDLGQKRDLYCRAGIADYWVVDVVNRRVIVHRDPGPEGYASIIAYAETEAIAPLAAPDHFLVLANLA